MDVQQSKYIERYQDSILKGKDVDEDELFLELENELEDDKFMSQYREQRVEQLSHEFQLIKSSRVELDSQYGNVKTITDEKQVIEETVDKKFTVIHFFKEDFQTCKVMDNKLLALSIKHLSTNFIRIDVIRLPFLVTKLNIKMLPCVIIYINGVERDRIVGFDKLGGASKQDFQLQNLEDFLYRCGVINRISSKSHKMMNQKSDNDDDSDLDI